MSKPEEAMTPETPKWKPEEAALITRMKKFNQISAPSRQDVDRLIELIERSLNERAAKDAEMARYREAHDKIKALHHLNLNGTRVLPQRLVLEALSHDVGKNQH